MPSRDLDFNPVYIVIEYESILASTEDIVAGGRGALRFAKDSVEVGVSHIDVGYNVVTNFWLTLGYNFAGFDDKDFAQACYTAVGPFLGFTFKADQGLLKTFAGRR